MLLAFRILEIGYGESQRGLGAQPVYLNHLKP